MAINDILTKGLYQGIHFIKKNSATILTIANAIGVIGTVYLSSKAGIEANKIIEEKKKEKGEDLTTIEKIKVAGPYYIPTAVVAGGTIACGVGSNVVNKKVQAGLTSACFLLEQAHKEYKDAVTDVYGKEGEQKIEEYVAQKHYSEYIQDMACSDKLLFWDEYSNRFYWKTLQEVTDAEYNFNRNFALRRYAELNEFYEFLGEEPTEYGTTVGWSIYAGEAFYGYSFVDFYHELRKLEDGTEYYAICMPFPPHADFMDY